MPYGFLDIAATPSVRAAQAAMGSEQFWQYFKGDRTSDRFTTSEAEFIAQRDSFYVATVSETGCPYVQHRGGPAGFLHVLDENTIAFADFTGNRQFISTGNLADNPKAQLFLMDYAHRQRLKIWGEARVETDPALVERLMPAGYKARAEQAIVFTVKAWDANCPQHIPQLVPVDEVVPAIVERDARIVELEKELAALRNSR